MSRHHGSLLQKYKWRIDVLMGQARTYRMFHINKHVRFGDSKYHKLYDEMDRLCGYIKQCQRDE